jgi:2-methylcitrate dehydratase PrpD
VRETAGRLLIDIAGLCVAARGSDYVRAAIDTWEAGGNSTAIGHARALDAAGAAFVNGTAAHGEDYDDTFEGGPVHAGVVIVRRCSPPPSATGSRAPTCCWGSRSAAR